MGIKGGEFTAATRQGCCCRAGSEPSEFRGWIDSTANLHQVFCGAKEAPKPDLVGDRGRVMYIDASARAAELLREGCWQEACTLLQGQLRRTPRNGVLWSQVCALIPIFRRPSVAVGLILDLCQS